MLDVVSAINLGMKLIFKNNDQQQDAEAKIIDGEEEDQLFVATSFSSRSSSECWLIDSGCTNHMTNDMSLLKGIEAHNHY